MFRNRKKPEKSADSKLQEEPRSVELLEIASQMFAEVDIHRVLSMAIDKAIGAAGAERGMIAVFGDDGDISFEVARNLNHQDIETPGFEVSRTILSRVRETGEAICLRNALDSPEFSISESTVRLQLLSVIAIPLAVGQRIFGILYLDNRSIEGAFEHEAMDFVCSMGEIISLAAFSTLQHRQLQNKVEVLESKLRDQYRFDAIIGNHASILDVLRDVSRVASTDATVLIRGESGTGKELVARALFQNSQRKSAEFVPINCGAIPENLLESELFGHVRGAFTGAFRDHIGWFERADNGTVFLDEISEMPAALQVKLLRVLQTGEYYPVGSSTLRKCDVRVLAASNRDLKERIGDGRFREDLYFRLNVVEIILPPLRERGSDIALLAEHFLKIYADRVQKPDLALSQQAMQCLLQYDYPGNIRELQNIIERSVIFAEARKVMPKDLPEVVRSSNVSKSGKKLMPFKLGKERVVSEYEKKYISEALQATGGNISRAAALSGLDMKNFRTKMAKYRIRAGDFKKP